MSRWSLLLNECWMTFAGPLSLHGGPSPIKRARRDSDESIDTPIVRKRMPIRVPSSTNSLKQVARIVADSHSVRKEPESSVLKKQSPTRMPCFYFPFINLSDLNLGNPSPLPNTSTTVILWPNPPSPQKFGATKGTALNVVNLGRKQTSGPRPWGFHQDRCNQRPASVVPWVLSFPYC